MSQRAAAVAKLAGAEKEAKAVAKDAAAANPGAETATEVEAVQEAAKEDKAHVRSEVAAGAVGRAKTPEAKAKAKALAAVKPTNSDPDNPGVLATAIASRSARENPDFFTVS